MIEIDIEHPDQPDVRALLAASDAYMASLYPEQSNHLLDLSALTRPEVTFIVARSKSGSAVGCGAVVGSGDDWVEIKRMFVCPSARGQKVGRQLLQRIEAIAAQRGASSIRLETGVSQPEALALYRSAGFTEIGPFGAYEPDPLSVFMEKSLVADAG
ncbi:GNAT family N-acetyltransferase [Peristeroidobacter agariperforans]|uniref:GNAT family N-acetyltransferase n=1 Tax=Peristeroidobacter agariperforans TaxID=268404 RepID=UPI00101D9F6F|nr:GNAT family N-acetyltransferase [Peristeroidobacter agariperforans]